MVKHWSFRHKQSKFIKNKKGLISSKMVQNSDQTSNDRSHPQAKFSTCLCPLNKHSSSPISLHLEQQLLQNTLFYEPLINFIPINIKETGYHFSTCGKISG